MPEVSCEVPGLGGEVPKVGGEVPRVGAEVPKVGAEVLVPNWKELVVSSEVLVGGSEGEVAMMVAGVEEVGMVRREEKEDTLGREGRGVKEGTEGGGRSSGSL